LKVLVGDLPLTQSSPV